MSPTSHGETRPRLFLVGGVGGMVRVGSTGSGAGWGVGSWVATGLSGPGLPAPGRVGWANCSVFVVHVD
jgi:hypothetical protein